MLNVDTDSLAFNGHCQQCNWTSLGFCIDNSLKTFQKKVTKIKNIALLSFHLDVLESKHLHTNERPHFL